MGGRNASGNPLDGGVVIERIKHRFYFYCGLQKGWKGGHAFHICCFRREPSGIPKDTVQRLYREYFPQDAWCADGKTFEQLHKFLSKRLPVASSHSWCSYMPLTKKVESLSFQSLLVHSIHEMHVRRSIPSAIHNGNEVGEKNTLCTRFQRRLAAHRLRYDHELIVLRQSCIYQFQLFTLSEYTCACVTYYHLFGEFSKYQTSDR